MNTLTRSLGPWLTGATVISSLLLSGPVHAFINKPPPNNQQNPTFSSGKCAFSLTAVQGSVLDPLTNISFGPNDPNEPPPFFSSQDWNGYLDISNASDDEPIETISPIISAVGQHIRPCDDSDAQAGQATILEFSLRAARRQVFEIYDSIPGTGSDDSTSGRYNLPIFSDNWWVGDYAYIDWIYTDVITPFGNKMDWTIVLNATVPHQPHNDSYLLAWREEITYESGGITSTPANVVFRGNHQVPAPAPIAGVLIAFRTARGLRKRIKSYQPRPKSF